MRYLSTSVRLVSYAQYRETSNDLTSFINKSRYFLYSDFCFVAGPSISNSELVGIKDISQINIKIYSDKRIILIPIDSISTNLKTKYCNSEAYYVDAISSGSMGYFGLNEAKVSYNILGLKLGTLGGDIYYKTQLDDNKIGGVFASMADFNKYCPGRHPATAETTEEKLHNIFKMNQFLKINDN
jgi:hypothetical protein